MKTDKVLADLEALGDTGFKAGLARFGINDQTALGIKLPVLRHYAKAYRKNHALALDLWETGVHEARLLAIFMADPKQVTEVMIEKWVRDFNSWDICDQACGGLIDKTPFAWAKAQEWAVREKEFEKRAGFALMAYLAIHDKKALNDQFLAFFPFILDGAQDERNFVKKAVNWALRQIGKRNLTLHQEAINLAQAIQRQGSKSGRWIAADALRELQGLKVLESLEKKQKL